MRSLNERMKARGQGGFTLIELLVVIAILAILGGAAVIGIGSMRDNAKNQTCKTEKATIETALEARDVDKNVVGTSTIANATTDGYLKKVTDTDWTVTHGANGYSVSPAAGGKYAGVACS